MIVTCATEHYAESLELLLASYAWSNPGGLAVVHLLGWNPARQAELAARCQFEIRVRPLPPSAHRRIVAGERAGEVLRIKCDLMAEACEEMGDAFFWVDADTLVLRSLEPLLARLRSASCDLLCTYLPHEVRERVFAAGVIGCAPTLGCGRLLRAVAAEARHLPGLDNWYQDQLALVHCYELLQPRLGRLSESEHSLRGNPQAVFVSKRDSFSLPELWHRCRESRSDRPHAS